MKVDQLLSITDSGELTLHLQDYCAQLTHTKEMHKVWKNKLYVMLELGEMEEAIDPCNIEFDPKKKNKEQTQDVDTNVLNELTN